MGGDLPQIITTAEHITIEGLQTFGQVDLRQILTALESFSFDGRQSLGEVNLLQRESFKGLGTDLLQTVGQMDFLQSAVLETSVAQCLNAVRQVDAFHAGIAEGIVAYRRNGLRQYDVIYPRQKYLLPAGFGISNGCHRQLATIILNGFRYLETRSVAGRESPLALLSDVHFHHADSRRRGNRIADVSLFEVGSKSAASDEQTKQ